MAMQRIRLTVRYDGTEFAGSQIQPGVRTVAGTLTDGLEKLLGQRPHLQWAGRTDAGVHANGNIACFDAELAFPLAKLPRMLEPRLPHDLVVVAASEAPPGFNPRYGALYREYRYCVYRGADVPVDRIRFTWAYQGQWDAAVAAEVLAGFTGRHAFQNYCVGSEPAEECICELHEASYAEVGPEVVFRYVGNRFLYGMIRRLTAAVLAATDGKVAASEVLAALTGPMTFKLKPAPPQGLTLERVAYPGEGSRPAGTPRADGMK
jgi:tRNA pseudouridine38-40 synthase